MKRQNLSLISCLVVIMVSLVWGGLALAKMNMPPAPYASYNSGAFFFPPYPADSDRMGFDKASGHDPSPLKAGWYLDWGVNANPAHPGGAEYARVIQLHTETGWCQPATEAGQITPALTGAALTEAVQANPGALWLVGNEPDSLYNGDSIQPELYAEFYHYFVTAIKAADPGAKVGVGGIVQPSPLRLEYLDKVLNHYQETYGQPLPADLWNIHFYILNEGPCGTWGGAIPPFSSQSTGWQIPFTAEALLDLATLENNLHAFRQWMYDRGYGDQPLLITEFGVLPPPDFPGFEDPVAAQFLSDMFEMFLTATDPVIGYAADGHRLVQMWAWFSTDFGPYGGDLFETGTTSDLTIIGQAFVAQANANYSPYVDLQVEPPAMTRPIKTETITSGTLIMGAFSAGVYVTNRGNITAADVQARIALTDYFDQTISEIVDYDLGDLGRRYNHAPIYLEKSWDIILPAAFTVTITVGPDQAFAEANLGNNTFSQLVAWFPDLALANLVVAPALFGPDEDVITSVVTATVTNIGNWASSEVPLQLQIRIDDTSVTPWEDMTTIPPLSPGQSLVLTTPWTISSSGLYQVEATINPQAIPGLEVNPENNVALQNVLINGETPGATIYLPLISKQSTPLLPDQGDFFNGQTTFGTVPEGDEHNHIFGPAGSTPANGAIAGPPKGKVIFGTLEEQK